jgi:hypothetical protein
LLSPAFWPALVFVRYPVNGCVNVRPALFLPSLRVLFF